MRFLLLALIASVTLSVVFSFDPGPAPGLKIKNALLYALALALAFRAALAPRDFRIQLPGIVILFGILVGYAMLTYGAIVTAIDYPRYAVLGSLFLLKNNLVDHVVFFLVFFYGLKDDEDTLLILKFLLAAWALAHLFAVLDALGILQIGDIEQRGDGRVEGAIGESNQYGAFVALSLPALVAMVFAAQGIRRFCWLIAALVTAGALLMTVSRGAYVATFVAAVAGLYLFRRYASFGRLALLAFTIVIGVISLVLVVVAIGFGDLLVNRVLGAMSSDVETASSGRTEIWATALAVMFNQPLTLLTGFGWNAYNAMPFRYAPHNFYLAQWFNLGLPGLVCSVGLLYLLVRTARSAIETAALEVRPLLMGFVIGTIAIASATFFVDLYMPWLYFWSYAGIMMRLAVNARERRAESVAVRTAQLKSAPPRDPFGWRGAVRY